MEGVRLPSSSLPQNAWLRGLGQPGSYRKTLLEVLIQEAEGK